MWRYCVASVPPAARARCGSSTCASPGGRSEFFANTMPARVRRHRVSHTALPAALLEPDALVVAAHRVEQQRDLRAEEDEREQRSERGESGGAEEPEQQQDLQDRRPDGNRVTPLLLVGDAVRAD